MEQLYIQYRPAVLPVCLLPCREIRRDRFGAADAFFDVPEVFKNSLSHNRRGIDGSIFFHGFSLNSGSLHNLMQTIGIERNINDGIVFSNIDKNFVGMDICAEFLVKTPQCKRRSPDNVSGSGAGQSTDTLKFQFYDVTAIVHVTACDIWLVKDVFQTTLKRVAEIL